MPLIMWFLQPTARQFLTLRYQELHPPPPISVISYKKGWQNSFDDLLACEEVKDIFSSRIGRRNQQQSLSLCILAPMLL